MGRTSTTVKDRWNKNNYDSLLIRIPKGRKADIERAAAALGQSLNGFVGSAIREALKMSEEAWRKDPEETPDA